jgi:hypothetical protein
VYKRCKTIQTDFAVSGGVKQKLGFVQFFDGLGRPWLQRQIEDGSAPTCDKTQTSGILTDTQYMLQPNVSRYVVQSNPFRLGELSDTSVGWTLTNFDQMARPVTVMRFSGAQAPTPSTTTGLIGQGLIAYNLVVPGIPGVAHKTTDESTNVVQTVMDGLGRVAGVAEYPSAGPPYQTTYMYDLSNNLYGVYQSGQTRSFVFDSLGRLTCSYNPEMVGTGVTASTPDRGCLTPGQLNSQGLAYYYTYDSNGNVIARSDARGATVSYSYDALNRIKFKSYGGSPAVSGNNAYAFSLAPSVTYCYDGFQMSGPGQCLTSSSVAYGHGRLTHVSAPAVSSSPAMSTLYTGFDAFGKVTGMQQSVGTNAPYLFSFTHNLGGKLTSMTFPSGPYLERRI